MSPEMSKSRERWGARRAISRIPVCFIVGGVMSLAGCGQPQLGDDKENYLLVMRLNTAVTGKRVELVDQVEKEAQGKAQAGAISSQVLQRIEEIAALARAGNWEIATTECFTFQRAQKPPRSP